MVSYVPQVEKLRNWHVCSAPPIIVGAWSMAMVLWQLHEVFLHIAILSHINFFSCYNVPNIYNVCMLCHTRFPTHI